MSTGAFSQNVGKLFSKLKFVTDNLLSKMPFVSNGNNIQLFVANSVCVMYITSDLNSYHLCRGERYAHIRDMVTVYLIKWFPMYTQVCELVGFDQELYS